MSQLDEAREALTSRVKTALAASAYSATPFWYPNTPFIQPTNAIWARMSIIGGEGVQADLGPNPTERHIGIVQFDVVVPEDKGTKTGNDFGEFLGNALKRQQISAGVRNTINLRTPSYSWVGRIDKGTDRLVVRIPFYRDAKA